MCLLIVAKPNSTPKKKSLVCACDSNPHGFGFAFHTGSKIYTFHSLDADQAIENFFKMRSKYPEAWAMFHARYATHGSVKLENCHPFNVGSDKKTILGHNGILPIVPSLGDDRTDSQLFADEFLPAFGLESLDDANFFDELEEFIGGSKIAIFTTDSRLENQIYILNENLGHWVKGVWYSNNSYQVPKIRTFTYKHWWDEPEDLDESVCEVSLFFDCLRCGNEHENQVTKCKKCSACIDCGSYPDECLCYVPKSWDRKFSFIDF